MAQNRVTIDPIKYLSKLPSFDGSFKNLHTFIDLVDRVTSILDTYDDVSKSIFLDIIKSKLVGQAKDVSDINNHLTSWTTLNTVLTNNFGDRLSIEQLYDQMRSLKFKTNAKNFYDDITSTLSRLNMKSRILYQNQVGYDAIITANKRTALDIFKNKLIEPMRSIIICRNPANIEDAMKILYDTNYAFYNPNPDKTSNKKFNKNQGKNFTNNHYSSPDRYNHTNSRYYQNANQHRNDNNDQPVANQSDNDRPIPMEVENFQRDSSTDWST